jgi:hypothetical protein
LNPNDPDALVLAGNIYYMLNNTDKSRGSFILARELLKKNGDLQSADEINSHMDELFSAAPVDKSI